MSEFVKPKINIGLLVFVLVIVLMLFVAAPIQAALGMWGLAITELLLLASAVIPAIIFRWDLREIFAFKIPTLRQVFGVLVLWAGGYIAVIVISLVTSYFFPEEMLQVSSFMLELFKSVPFPVTLFIIAVMPAICEEALHRGLILHTFKGTNKWVTIIAMGIIFGIFHLDPFRFLGTAVLGVLLTYIMVETRNILLPVLFHFVNNSLSAFSSLLADPGAEITYIPLASIGIYLVITAAVPFLLIAGSKLLKTKEESRNHRVSKKGWITATILAAVVFVTGVGITAVSMADLLTDISGEPVFETSYSGNVDKTQHHNLDFSVEEDGSYFMTLEIEGSGVITEILILDNSNEEVYNVTCESMTSEGPIDLKAGDYLVIITHDHSSNELMPVSVDVTIKKSLLGL